MFRKNNFKEHLKQKKKFKWHLKEIFSEINNRAKRIEQDDRCLSEGCSLQAWSLVTAGTWFVLSNSADREGWKIWIFRNSVWQDHWIQLNVQTEILMNISHSECSCCPALQKRTGPRGAIAAKTEWKALLLRTHDTEKIFFWSRLLKPTKREGLMKCYVIVDNFNRAEVESSGFLEFISKGVKMFRKRSDSLKAPRKRSSNKRRLINSKDYDVRKRDFLNNLHTRF